MDLSEFMISSLQFDEIWLWISLEVFRRRGLTFIRHLIPGGERERSVCRLTISRGGFALTTSSVKHLIFLLTRRLITLGRPIICLKLWLYWKCRASDILSDSVPSTFKLSNSSSSAGCDLKKPPKTPKRAIGHVPVRADRCVWARLDCQWLSAE